MLSDVYFFNKSILGINRPAPARLSEDEAGWLLMALREEVTELQDSKTLEEDVDALIDLIYFAIGGLCRLGLTKDQAKEAFKAVHRVNVMKKAGVKPSRPQNGSVADAVKPDDLPDPLVKIRRILE